MPSYFGVRKTGEATEAAQLAGNAELAAIAALIPPTIDGKVSVVVDNTVLVDGSAHTQPVSGTVAVNNLPAVQPVSGIISVSNFPATQPVSGTVSVSSLPTVAINNFPSTQPISGTVTANIGTSTLALDTSVNSLLKPASTLTAVTSLGSITNAVTIKADTAANQTNALKVDGSATTQPVSGPLTNTQLRATPVSVTVGGYTVPTLSKNLKSRYAIAPVVVGAAYTTIFTRSGVGLFFGHQTDYNSANVFVKLTIDGTIVHEVLVSDIKLFQFTDTSTGRMQRRGFWGTVGNTLDFSPPFSIPYSTSIALEVKRSDASNHQLNSYMVNLTEE